MSEDAAMKFSKSDPNKLDLILLTLQRLQEDVELAKCQIKTSVREVANQQNYMNDSFYKLVRNLKEIDERLHGMELTQQRENSQT